MAGVPGLDVDFNKHVEDLEEWNEDAGFVWESPTVIVSNVVTVVHPHTYPNVGPGIQGDPIFSTAIAVYGLDGKRKALWILDRDAHGSHRDHNYWGMYDA